MSRLITFGCSYTYGIGLPDCYELDSNTMETSSKLSWPNIVNKKLNKTLVNYSASGKSNFEILYDILNFNFEENDIVVVMWSNYARDTFFRKFLAHKWPIDKIGAWSASKNWLRGLIDPNISIGNKWVEYMNDKTFIIKTWVYIHHADLYLQTKNIKYIHFPYKPSELAQYKQNLKINNLYEQGFQQLDLGHDGGHPGLKSHEATANVILGILNAI